jgi:hypothetical protein
MANPNRFTFIECVEQAFAVGLACELVRWRVGELSLVVANLGGGFGECVLVAQFLCSEIAVKTGLITRRHTEPINSRSNMEPEQQDDRQIIEG